jgi:DNA-binding FadR family transcriptional regulator
MRYFAESISRNHERVIHEVCEEHLEILGALRGGDPDAAEAAVLRHIENSERRTLSSTYGSVKSEQKK